MNHRERHVLIVTCYGHFMSHFNMLVFPAVVLPLSGMLNMEMANVLGISFWMYLLFGITALPWGIAADRWGPIPLLLLFHFGAGLSALAAGVWINSPSALSLCLAFLGCFSGIYHPAGLGWISKEIERISLGMAYNGIFGNLGLAAAPLMAGMVNWIWGPGAVFFTLGALNLAGGALIFFAPKSEAETSSPSGSAAKGEESVRAFMILLAVMTLGGIVFTGSTLILPAYFELKNRAIFQWFSALAIPGLSANVVATAFTSAIYLLGILGQYAGGLTAERFELRRSYLLFHCITVLPAFFMAFTTDLPLVTLATIYFFFLLGMQPIENTLVARFTPKKFHSIAYGTKFILTFGVGSLSVKMVEKIKLNFGIEAVFPALGLVSVALVTGIVILIFNTSDLRFKK